MAVESSAESSRLIYRALGVTQRLVKKVANGVVLKREELRAGDLATQALRACIADPGNAHRQALLIHEAERLAPKPQQGARPERKTGRNLKSRQAKGATKPRQRNRAPSETAKKTSAPITIKKKPRRSLSKSGFRP